MKAIVPGGNLVIVVKDEGPEAVVTIEGQGPEARRQRERPGGRMPSRGSNRVARPGGPDNVVNCSGKKM